jgi:hypothetical protein
MSFVNKTYEKLDVKVGRAETGSFPAQETIRSDAQGEKALFFLEQVAVDKALGVVKIQGFTAHLGVGVSEGVEGLA